MLCLQGVVGIPNRISWCHPFKQKDVPIKKGYSAGDHKVFPAENPQESYRDCMQ